MSAFVIHLLSMQIVEVWQCSSITFRVLECAQTRLKFVNGNNSVRLEQVWGRCDRLACLKACFNIFIWQPTVRPVFFSEVWPLMNSWRVYVPSARSIASRCSLSHMNNQSTEVFLSLPFVPTVLNVSFGIYAARCASVEVVYTVVALVYLCLYWTSVYKELS